MELVKLDMLLLISLLILDTVLDQELVNLRLEQKGDIDQVFAQFVQKSG